MQIKNKIKIQNIEFLRFWFAISIIFFHIFHAGKNNFGDIFKTDELALSLQRGSYGGFFAVDMFFIIAGFFLFLTLKKEVSVIDFIKKKIARLYPLVVFFSAVDIIFSIFVYKIHGYLPHREILRLLMLDNIGLNVVHSGITWYISSLFWGLLIYFYLSKIFEKKYLDFIVVIIIVFCYSFLIHAYNGYLNNAHTISWYNVFNGGFMRSLAGIGCGYFICEFYKNIKSYYPTVLKTLFYTGLEGFLLFFVFNNLLFHKINYKENFIIILGFIGLFILFLLKRGYISRLFDNKLSVCLGKYAYSIFIVHIFIIELYKKYLWFLHRDFVNAHIIFSIIITIVTSIIAGIIVYHFIEKPAGDYLKKKLSV